MKSFIINEVAFGPKTVGLMNRCDGYIMFEMGDSMAKVTFNEERCKGCRLCTTVCPKNIVVMSTTKLNLKGFHPAGVTEMEKCIGCGFCATICPDCIIEVEK